MKELGIKTLSTELPNENTVNIDRVDSLKKVEIMVKEYGAINNALVSAKEQIANAIDVLVKVVKNGGRVIYVGAGTSGRLGALDASEILPTYGDGDIFKFVMAGGQTAITSPVENAEDNESQAVEDLVKIDFSSNDVLVGISASGRTPYVVAAIQYAKKLSATTVSLATAKDSLISTMAEYPIEVFTGPEIITGSTRMLSGSAQKQVLNILSTSTMIEMGKVYRNTMISLKPTNEKLKHRAAEMVIQITGASNEDAWKELKICNFDVNVTLTKILNNISVEESIERVKKMGMASILSKIERGK